MPNNNRSRNSSRSKSKRSNKNTAAVNQRRDLVTSNKMQEIKFAPEIVDVPFPHIKRGKAHTVIQSYALSYNAATFYGGISITFAALPDAASFEACFDQFRFDTVRIQFLPNTEGIYTVTDITDATAPTALTQLLQYDTLQIVPPNVISERVWHPACALQSGAESAVYRGWCSTDSTAVTSPWYGLKFAGANVVALNLIVTVVVNLRSSI